jgi:predicted CopG family antitoxin
MKSELDDIKSTITVSLGTMNRLKKLKGGDSYEEYINYLLNIRNQITHNPDNLMELQKISRKKAIYNLESFKVIFKYNQFNGSRNFSFDISLDKVRDNGKIVPFSNFLNYLREIFPNKNGLDVEYRTYFQLLQIAIQKEIQPRYKHKGRFEDYRSWENDFEKLGLYKTAFEEDVMEKLQEYQKGRRFFEDEYR